MDIRNALRSEDTEQINVIQWAQWKGGKYPELKWLHHIPNGGRRNKQEAVKLKQMGVKAGVSDLCLPYPKGAYCGLYIEMKYGEGRKQQAQKEFLSDMAEAGHFTCTCYSCREAAAVLEQYLTLGKGENMPYQNNCTLKNGKVLEEQEPQKENKKKRKEGTGC